MFYTLVAAIALVFKKLKEGIQKLLFSDKKRMASKLWGKLLPILLFVGLWMLIAALTTALSISFISPLITALVITAVVVAIRWRKNMKKASADTGSGAVVAEGADAPGGASAKDTVVQMEKLRFLTILIRAGHTIVGLATVILLLVGFVQGAQGSGGMLPFGIGILCGILYFVLLRISTRMRARSKALFKDNLVLRELNRYFDDLRYEPGRGFDTNAFQELNIFYDGLNETTGNDWVEASYKGTHFCMADAFVNHTKERSYSFDEDGNRYESTIWKRCFGGRVLRFAFEQDFGEGVQVLSEDFMDAKFSRQNTLLGIPDGWEAVDVELYEFNRQFNVFAPSAQHALQILKPQLLEAMHLVREKIALPILFCYKGNELFLFIDSEGEDMFDISYSAKRSTAKEKELLHKQVDMITGFLDTMYLKGAVEAAQPTEAQASL